LTVGWSTIPQGIVSIAASDAPYVQTRSDQPEYSLKENQAARISQ